jgi:hypothetical protein
LFDCLFFFFFFFLNHDVFGFFLPTSIFIFLQSIRSAQSKRLETMPLPATVLDTLATCPVVVHLAATGDEGLSRRVHDHALPLLESAGIASIVLEIPFYGSRRARSQFGWSDAAGGQHAADGSESAASSAAESWREHKDGTYVLSSVAELTTQSVGCVHEATAVVAWLTGLAEQRRRRRQQQQQRDGGAAAPPRRLGVAGVSYGGAMAALTLSLSPVPLRCVSMVPSRSGAAPFCHGVMAARVDWDALGKSTWDDDDAANQNAACESMSQPAETNERLFRVLEVQASLDAIPPPEHVRAEHRYLQMSAKNDWFIPFVSAQQLFRDVQAMLPTEGSARLVLIAGGHAWAFVRGKSQFVRGIQETMERD